MINKVYIHRIIYTSAMVLGLVGSSMLPAHAQTQATVETLAGGSWGISSPRAAVKDISGNVYVADYEFNQIFKISPDGKKTILAGVANSNADCADGTGTRARFKYPSGLAIDQLGNLYVADSGNNAIRKICIADGKVTTVAGAPASRISFADGIGRNARFNFPFGIAIDQSGNLYVADSGNNAIRKICIADGKVTTVAGDPKSDASFADGSGRKARFNSPMGVAVDANGGNIYVADSSNHAIRKICIANGAVTTLSGVGNWTQDLNHLCYPVSVAVGPDGVIYVADTWNNVIRKYATNGNLTTLAGTGQPGHLDGTGASASFFEPYSVSVDFAGNLCVSDCSNKVIRTISPVGDVRTVGSSDQGDKDGTGVNARFNVPQSIVLDDSGNLYVADVFNFKIRKITPNGNVTTLAGSGAAGYKDARGSDASFGNITGLTMDMGLLYVADEGNGVIRRIDPDSGDVTTFNMFTQSRSPKYPYQLIYTPYKQFSMGGLVMQGGCMYLATPDSSSILRVYNNGVVDEYYQKYFQAYFNSPQGLTKVRDRKSMVSYVADLGNSAIYKIESSIDFRGRWIDLVTTLAGSGSRDYIDAQGKSAAFGSIYDLTCDSSGNIYVADSGNSAIRKITPDGWVTTLAGGSGRGARNGAAATASFASPHGVAFDPKLNILYVADTDNNLIRKIKIK